MRPIQMVDTKTQYHRIKAQVDKAVNDVFESNGSGKKKKGSINPSGISIHPLNGDMYIVDGRNSKLLITDAAGTIKKLYQLNSKEFAQPEGISFNSTGDLFIANEGTNQPGNILQVKIDTE